MTEAPILILTGPTAAGKNTIGRLIAHRRERCAVVDFDLVRAMFVQPHRAPWQGAEGQRQHLLGVQLAAQLAHGFAADGWEVVILDVLTDPIAQTYRKLLAPRACRIVQLLPEFPELRRRFDGRGPVLTDAELTLVYAQQQTFTGYDERIDNTVLAAADVAELVLEGWPTP